MRTAGVESKLPLQIQFDIVKFRGALSTDYSTGNPFLRKNRPGRFVEKRAALLRNV